MLFEKPEPGVDANLTTTNDFIAAYAQVEPLEKEYEAKLDRFSELFHHARRETATGVFRSAARGRQSPSGRLD